MQLDSSETGIQSLIGAKNKDHIFSFQVDCLSDVEIL